MTEVLAGRRCNKSVTSPHIILVIRSIVVNMLYENEQIQQYTYNLVGCQVDVGFTRKNINNRQ